MCGTRNSNTECSNHPTVKQASLSSTHNIQEDPCQFLAEGKVVGGVSAYPHEFPHQIRLNDGHGRMICSGTIINALFILTAAHCLKHKSMRVIAGDHDWTLKEDSEQHREVLDFFIPQGFNSDTFENDIALLELSQPLKFNQYVKNIPYPRAENSLYENNVIASGWGKVTEKGTHSDILKKVSLKLVNTSMCEKSYRRTLRNVKSHTFCASSRCKDTCQGDSGGPVLCKETNSNKTVVCGVVSYGLGCARPEYPGVYTNVSYFWQWIERTMTDSPRNYGKNCKTLFHYGNTQSGVYAIQPNGLGNTPLKAYCDMERDGGGWTIIQRRGVRPMPKSQRESFNRNWTEYEYGFGSPDDDHWIGLENMHSLTGQCENELKITLTEWDGTEKYGGHSNFQVAGRGDKYRLTLGRWTGGTLFHKGNIMERNNGMKFTTFDNDNDKWDGGNCAVHMKGAWWHYGKSIFVCTYVSLNGEYAEDGSNGNTEDSEGWPGIYWFPHFTYSFMKSEMKIRSKC